jgi:hypothetical protein
MFVKFQCTKKKCGNIDDILHQVDPYLEPPKCSKCGAETDVVKDNTVRSGISFKGLSTPGSSSSTPNFNKLPSEIQGWAKKKYAQDREINEQAKKPIRWPDGKLR